MAEPLYCDFLFGICLRPEVWAAWTQAILSVAAIFAAIWIGDQQASAARRLQTTLKADEVLRQINHGRTLVEMAVGLAGRSLTGIEGVVKGRPGEMERDNISEVVAILSQAVVMPMPSMTIEFMLTARHLLVDLLGLIDGLRDRFIGPEDPIHEKISRMRQQTMELQATLKASRAATEEREFSAVMQRDRAARPASLPPRT